MWAGYLQTQGGRRVGAVLSEHNTPRWTAHASGHATVEDLQRLARAVSPHAVIPMHTAAPHEFMRYFERAHLYPDGEWWTC